MLHAQQVQNLLKFWQKEDGSPVTQNILIGERELEVPLMSLVPHSLFTIDHENFIEAEQILLLNGFMKKSTKDYKKEIQKAEQILNSLQQ